MSTWPSESATSVWNVSAGRPATTRQAPISVMRKSGELKFRPVVSRSTTAKGTGKSPSMRS